MSTNPETNDVIYQLRRGWYSHDILLPSRTVCSEQGGSPSKPHSLDLSNHPAGEDGDALYDLERDSRKNLSSDEFLPNQR